MPAISMRKPRIPVGADCTGSRFEDLVSSAAWAQGSTEFLPAIPRTPVCFFPGHESCALRLSSSVFLPGQSMAPNLESTGKPTSTLWCILGILFIFLAASTCLFALSRWHPPLVPLTGNISKHSLE